VPKWLGKTSLRTRLTAWNALVVLLMTVCTLTAVRVAARATLYDDADVELRAAAQEVVMAIQDLHPDMRAVTAEMQRKAESHAQRGWFLQLLTESGTTIWKSRYCPNEVASFPPSNLDREELVAQVGPYRYVRLRLPRVGETALHVRVGTYTTGLDDRLTGLMRSLLAVGTLLCLVTPLVGYWLARQATRPVAAILDAAARLSPTRLDDRLPLRGTGDELDQLSSTINRLLDAVAMHVARQEQFVADAAHELRGRLRRSRVPSRWPSPPVPEMPSSRSGSPTCSTSHGISAAWPTTCCCSPKAASARVRWRERPPMSRRRPGRRPRCSQGSRRIGVSCSPSMRMRRRSPRVTKVSFVG
jgi:HAMP domain-containing protein